jgi:F0F1-type ATP synthase membrane subunit b/b'
LQVPAVQFGLERPGWFDPLKPLWYGKSYPKFAVPRFLIIMIQTLHDLGGIVLNGLPTFFLIIILAVFVKFLYLRPLERVLAERFQLTEGARKAAEESLKNADTKIAEYQDALNRARNEIYQEQADYLQKLHDEQAELARAARLESDGRVAAIKLSIAQDADAARDHLERQSESLAAEITAAILGRRAA